MMWMIFMIVICGSFLDHPITRTEKINRLSGAGHTQSKRLSGNAR
jgi:hypothetical protein